MDKNKIKKEIASKLKKEMSMTSTGASVTPGVGAGVATKYAFGKRDNKGTPSDWKAAPSIPNRKSKAMDYKELWEEENEWPEEVLSRHRDMKFIKQKASSDKATYQIVDLENNNKPIGDMVFGSVKNLKDFADDYIKPQGGRQSTQLEEVIIPDNIKKFAQRKGVTNTVNQIARWAEKAGYSVMGGTAIGKDYSTLILDLTYQGSEVYINTDTNTIEVKGEEVDNYNSFVRALKEEIKEGYARFRNETKTRTKPEQFHSAVKDIKKKVNEINRLFEYMNRLQSELSESEGGLKYKKYTEKALQQIKESTKQLFFKSTKLK